MAILKATATLHVRSKSDRSQLSSESPFGSNSSNSWMRSTSCAFASWIDPGSLTRWQYPCERCDPVVRHFEALTPLVLYEAAPKCAAACVIWSPQLLVTHRAGKRTCRLRWRAPVCKGALCRSRAQIALDRGFLRYQGVWRLLLVVPDHECTSVE